MRRRLDVELVRRGLVASRGQAVEVLDAGRVLVAGAPATKPGRLVGPDEAIVVAGEPRRFVSRGGDKLEAALDRFGVEVVGQRALDAGASTGGFTDCLLQRGAREVVAVDVGHGQLAWSLRHDPRVVVLEGTNVRHLALEEPVPLTVADLSFISLATVAPALRAATTADGTFVLLVKPQFEAGPERLARGGVVRDPAVHRSVLTEVVEALGRQGIVVRDLMASPLRGPAGNVEFLALAGGPAAADGAPVGDAAIDAALAEVPA
jgi:23S rRNA (cytidine1920-2'-O)/16S rRNA (cytidine1409-2'-O)-methyltransferase